jgi:HEAT repeat protein
MSEEQARNLSAMNHPLLVEQLAAQLQSPNVKDRVLAMIEVQKETLPAQAALPLIKQALTDKNIQVRGMAAFTLGIKPTPENLSLLVQILVADSDPNMRAMAAGALGYLEDPQALEPLRHAFYEDTEWLVQFSAAVALGNLKNPEAQTVLLTALANPNLLLQEAAIMALGEIGAVSAIPALLPFIDAEDWLIRKRVAEALGNLPSDRSLVTLTTLSQDPHPEVAAAAQRSLQHLNQTN